VQNLGGRALNPIIMTLHIYTLDKTLYDGSAASVSLPTSDGIITVLQNHEPLVTVLKKGNIIAKIGSEEKTFAIKNGFAKISGESVLVLAEE